MLTATTKCCVPQLELFTDGYAGPPRAPWVDSYHRSKLLRPTTGMDTEWRRVARDMYFCGVALHFQWGPQHRSYGLGPTLHLVHRASHRKQYRAGPFIFN